MADTHHHPLPGGGARAVAVDRRAASRLVDDLADRGIPSERITTRAARAEASPRPAPTREADSGFVRKMGEAVGVGWLVAFCVGAVIGVVVTSVLFEPPWASAEAAGIALGVAVGMGYIAAAVGFIQAAIARAGEQGRGQEPLVGDADDAVRPGWGAAGPGGGAPAAPVEVLVEPTADEAETVAEVLDAHRGELIAVEPRGGRG